MIVDSARNAAFVMLAVASVFTTSCEGNQSALDPAGMQSEHLSYLWWVFFLVTAIVYAIVMAVLIVAFFRRRRSAPGSKAEIIPDPASDKRAANVIKGSVAITVITIFALMITSFRAGRAIDSLSSATEPVIIKVTGQQWWWQVEYQDPVPSNTVTTANEIHVPVGRPIKIVLQSTDVIHSFWVPNLHGKRDLIPNYPTTIYFQADKPGTYWGQCAEFCGYEHAKMRFIVKAESPGEFKAWLESARRPAAEPTTDSQRFGRQIFLTSVCNQCHTINGTNASGRIGPNLTHIASREFIASGTLPNTGEHLMRWITDPQAIKPGTRMPMNVYSDDELNALIDYLQSLK